MKNGNTFDVLGRQLLDGDLVITSIGHQLRDAMVTASGLLVAFADGKRVPMPEANHVLLMVPRNGDRRARWAEIVHSRRAMRHAYATLAT